VSEKVAVLGAGICGLVASWTLARAGIECVVISASAGETEQSSGAWDVEPWTQALLPSATPPELAEFLSDLGLFRLASAKLQMVVASSSGVLRGAGGVGSGILDLSSYAGKNVGVAEVGRDDFDARWLARSFSEQHWAQQTGTRFVVAPLMGAYETAEANLPLAVFSHLLENEERSLSVTRSLERLRLTHPDLAVVLGGPWLGTRLHESSGTGFFASLPLPLFETLHPPEGPWGGRFERARTALLQRLTIRHEHARVVEMREDAEGVTLRLLDMSGTPFALERRYSKVIVATGGVLGGGTEIKPFAGGAQLGWSIHKPGPELSSGELGGWDPSLLPRGWLYDDQAAQAVRGQRVLRSAVSLLGTGTLGRAAARGRSLALRCLKQDS